MAFEERLETQSVQAAGDLSGSQYRAVQLDGSGRVGQAAVAGGAILGVLQDAPAAAGRAACVATGGTTKWLAGATVAAGAEVTTDATGRAIAAAVGNQIHGRAMTGGVVGAIISVNLKPRPAVA